MGRKGNLCTSSPIADSRALSPTGSTRNGEFLTYEQDTDPGQCSSLGSKGRLRPKPGLPILGLVLSPLSLYFIREVFMEVAGFESGLES